MASLSDLASLLGLDTSKAGGYGTPAKLLDNLERTESSGNAKAINPKTGAMGAYQFMPDTVAMLHKQGIQFDPMNKQEARAAADQYIQQLVRQNGGDYTKALAQYGGFKTQDPSGYVSKVIAGVPEVATKQPTQNADDLAKQLGLTAPTGQVTPPVSPVLANTTPGESIQHKQFGEAIDAASTFLKNIGDAVTFGTAKYPAAALMTVTGDGTYKENLAKVREMSQAENVAHPVAALTGQLTGAGAQTVLTGGGNLIRQLGISAASAGTQAYTETEDAKLSDAAKAAAIGIGFTGVGGALGAGMKWINGKWVQATVKDINQRVPAINKDIQAANEALAKQNTELAAKERAAYVQSMTESGPVAPHVPTPPSTPIPPMQKFTPETYTAAVQSGEVIPKAPVQTFMDAVANAKKQAPAALTGAAVGAGAGYLVSDEQSSYLTPAITSAVGGLVGGVKAKVVNQALQNWMIKNPGAAEQVATLSGRALGQPEAQYVTQPEAMGIQAPAAPISLLRQELNRYDAAQATKTATSESDALAKELGLAQ